MGPFPNSECCEYILVVVDYVSKWVEVLPCQAADAMHSKRMFHEVIFPRYGVPRIVISDGGSHFIGRTFLKAHTKVGVDHQIATPYHPQTSGQAEISNKQIKNIFQKIVNQCPTQFLCQNQVLIVCMTQDQLFHTYGQKCSQITKCHK
jgi:hypothetical protein